MLAEIKIEGLDKAEATAKEILEHVDAIRRLQSGAVWPGLTVTVNLKKEADSCN